MVGIWLGIFGLAGLALVHSYIIYPLSLKWWGQSKQLTFAAFDRSESLPVISILMAAYNEEKVIHAKIQSLRALNYPEGLINIFIGSDCSTDKTDTIIRSFQPKCPNLYFYPFTERTGKPGIINYLAQEAFKLQELSNNHLFLLTDANVILDQDCAYHLAKYFKTKEIALVDAHMTHTGMTTSGISKTEDHYISREVQIKHLEGKIWGKMVGPFGGCYMIRSNYYHSVPANYLVDDFYLTMKIFEKGGWAINSLEALAFEPVSHEIKTEFRRKIRISAGNFQNMFAFFRLWWPPKKGLQYAFFSHKVLRWLGPFFLLLVLVAGIALFIMEPNNYYWVIIILGTGFIGIPISDYLFSKIGWHISLFRSIRYFILMNIALFIGFIKYINGIESNIWKPTKRNP